MNRYLIIQPSLGYGDPQRLYSGVVISRHRSVGAARAGFDRAHRVLRRQPGQSQSWYDWVVVHEVDGKRTIAEGN